MVEQTVTLVNPTGLHARPASVFVQTANKYRDTMVRVIKGDREADAKSILGILGLGASRGSSVTLRAVGPNEEQAVQALAELITSGFGE